ncbi:hypothetical protein GCM10010236_03930 [Streptomyces eurythermus]|nr:hypothetical protein GCM10010236_03930 [Streptomyces eurythermus]
MLIAKPSAPTSACLSQENTDEGITAARADGMHVLDAAGGRDEILHLAFRATGPAPITKVALRGGTGAHSSRDAAWCWDTAPVLG